MNLNSELSATKSALSILDERWPAAIPLTELASLVLERAASFLGDHTEASRRAMIEDLFRCVLSGAVELHTWTGAFVTEISERPRVDALVAHQAAMGPLVVNARHETVALDALGRELVGLLDGRRNREAILAELIGRVADSRLSIQSTPATGDPEVQNQHALAVAMDGALGSIARSALLVG